MTPDPGADTVGGQTDTIEQAITGLERLQRIGGLGEAHGIVDLVIAKLQRIALRAHAPEPDIGSDLSNNLAAIGYDLCPIPLNEAQQKTASEWAADDRLWTTQETVEANLRTFARTILRDAKRAPEPDTTLKICPACMRDIEGAPEVTEQEEKRGLVDYVRHKPECEMSPVDRVTPRSIAGRYGWVWWRSPNDGTIREKQEHVCGLSGFGAAGDTCPGCEGETSVRDPRCTCGLDAVLKPAEATVREGWQPIETAPKDGRRIIVWHPEIGVREGWHGFPSGIYGSWNVVTNAQPTHWMPLPPPPETLEG